MEDELSLNRRHRDALGVRHVRGPLTQRSDEHIHDTRRGARTSPAPPR